MSQHTSFVSYSQNGEDVLLWRTLGHVANGFYIDVGASDPIEHSVTRAFYERGWRGINIEPLPAFHQPFLEQRPRDVNLALAAGASEGELTLYDVPEVRGWASPEQTVADLHRAEGHTVAELKVPVRPLSAICAEHVTGEIHFLKIDVEGFEGEVLRGMDFARWRPWVLVIEATLPNSRATNHEAWEHMVLGQRYRYAWFDGLNRYYVAEEHAELLAHLDIQPNVFDNFISHHLDDAWRQIETLQTRSSQGWDRAAELERSALQLQAQFDQEARKSDMLAQQGELLRQQLHHHLRDRETIEQAWAQQRELLNQRLRDREALEQAWMQQQRDRELLEQAWTQQRELLEQQLLNSNSAAHRHEVRANEAVLQIDLLTARLHESAAWGQGLEQRVLAMQASTSWRITAPLRLLARAGRGGGSAMVARKARGAARRALGWLTSRQALRRALLPLLMRSPRLHAWASRTLHAAKQATADVSAPERAVPSSLRELPQSARDALEQLRRAYEARQE